MNILFVGNKPAFPKVDGGCVASAAFLHDLIASGNKVHYAFLHTSKHPYSKEAFPNSIIEQIDLSERYINTRIKKFDALKNIFNSSSFNVERFYNEEFADQLVQLIHEKKFDAVIFDNVFASRYMAKIKTNFDDMPCFVRAHNVEFEIWEDLASSSKNRLVRWYLKRLAKDLKRFEIETLSQVNGVMTITVDDKDTFVKHGIKTPMTHIPVSVSIPDYEHDYSNKDLFYLGALNWRPNVEAVDTVLKYLPVWLNTDENIVFSIAGIQSKERYDHLTSKNVLVHGFVQDLGGFIEKQGILVAPIQSGSGVRIKILEMMAYGIPIITTSLGAQGIKDLSGICIADDHQAMEKAVYALRNDEKKRLELGKQAKSIITLHHNSDTTSREIIEFINR